VIGGVCFFLWKVSLRLTASPLQVAHGPASDGTSMHGFRRDILYFTFNIVYIHTIKFDTYVIMKAMRL